MAILPLDPCAEVPGSWTLAGAGLIGASAWTGACAAARERAALAD